MNFYGLQLYIPHLIKKNPNHGADVPVYDKKFAHVCSFLRIAPQVSNATHRPLELYEA